MSNDDGWSEEKFRALTLHSVDIISLLDGQGRLLFNSPATVRINGFTPEELLNRETFELIHPDDRAEVGRVFADVLATKGTVRRVEYRYLTKDGRWLWMEAVASNQLDNPAVRGVVANSRDISERKAAEAERARLEQNVQHLEKLESLGLMAGGVAHDFNNLLAVILAEVSVARADPSSTNEVLEHIEKAAQSAASLTRQLLSSAGRARTQMVATDVRALIEAAAPVLQRAVRGVTLDWRLEANVPAVRCDPVQLNQLLMNLVINAGEASQGQGVVGVRLLTREVTADELAEGPLTTGFAPGRAVVLEVRDAGHGMTPETMRHVFDPFFSTRRQGRGLGLAVVASFVRNHGAALHVRSAPQVGSTFSLFLRPTGDAVVRPAPPAVMRFEGRALVIDDDPLVLRTTTRLLTALGFDCVGVDTGAAALARFREDVTAWTIVVSDLMMPGVDGATTVDQLRALNPKQPALFVSGYSAGHGTEPDVRTGFISKPFSANALTAELARLVPHAVVQGIEKR
ncbi:MAG: PAS domain S-box protein [Archangium sp.]|nr:PAS domain S-box protein [Archangium sp.]